MGFMVTRKQWRRFINLPAVQWSMFILGLLLLVCAAIVGPIPGPGGVLFAVPGLILLLNSSMWARRNYARLKRWEHSRAPVILGRKVTPGRWADLMLRRPSALRRERLRKQREMQEAEQAASADPHVAQVGALTSDQLLGSPEPGAVPKASDN